MKLRDPKNPQWITCLCEIFEARWQKEIVSRHGNCDVILDFLDDILSKDPRSCGDRIDRDDGEFWVWENPPIGHLPPLRVLYMIDDTDRKVYLMTVSTGAT